jgi:hypothetical protein
MTLSFCLQQNAMYGTFTSITRCRLHCNGQCIEGSEKTFKCIFGVLIIRFYGKDSFLRS